MFYVYLISKKTKIQQKMLLYVIYKSNSDGNGAGEIVIGIS